MLFLSHSYTNLLEGLEGTQSVWSPADFSPFHRWIRLILGYVVRLDVSFILDGGDRKIFLQQGFVLC
jgi:hypothetical protein